MARIPGKDVRDRILAIMREPVIPPSQDLQQKVLASKAYRNLLEIVARRRPRSINELTLFAGQDEREISRSLNALAKAGLLTMVPDGRASVPTLTLDAERLMVGLQSSPEVVRDARPAIGAGDNIFGVNLSKAVGDLDSDEVWGDLIVGFRNAPFGEGIEARKRTDLNDFGLRLLDNWWRIVCRRTDPYNLLDVGLVLPSHQVRATLCVVALGERIQLVATPEGAASPLIWRYITQDRFTDAVLKNVIEPVVRCLRQGRRFDRPIENALKRLEDDFRYPNERAFCRTAGALGLRPYGLDQETAAKVRQLIAGISEDDARLDFASAIEPKALTETWEWVEHEISAKKETNSLPALAELHRKVRPQTSEMRVPHDVGYGFARTMREAWNLKEDEPLGGMSGIAKRLGGRATFAPSSAGAGRIRGFQACGDTTPIIVIGDEGPRSNAFLMARAVGDYGWFGSREAPVADLYTNRQALGRAFAAEFLAPGAPVVRMVEAEGRSFDEIADHFGVTPQVISHQYENATKWPVN